MLNSNRCYGQTGYAGGSNGGNGEGEGGNGSGVDIGTFTFINDPMIQWNVFDLTPGEGGEAGMSNVYNWQRCRYHGGGGGGVLVNGEGPETDQIWGQGKVTLYSKLSQMFSVSYIYFQGYGGGGGMMGVGLSGAIILQMVDCSQNC